MARFHATAAGPVAFTAQEETDTDAREAAIAAAAPAVAAENQRLADIDTAIQGASTVQAFANMTVAQQDAWWTANVTNAAQAIAILKLIVRYLLRKVR